MALVVNTNILALNAQRNLDRSSGILGKALERLSSGLRVNSAADDAAGLAISDRMYAQVRGLNQAVRNANDGISLSQTAESALQEYTSIVQRMRELAVQSANATNTATDRSALDAEYQQLNAELDRIATQTTFNGNAVLNGTLGNITFQVGAFVGNTISLSLSAGVRTNQVGQIAQASGANPVDANAIATGEVTINGTAVVASVAGSGAGQTADSAYAKAAAINASGVAGVTAAAVPAPSVATSAFANGTSVVYNANAAAQTYSLSINGVAIYSAFSLATATGLSASALATQINVFSNQTGVSASVDGSSNLVLTASDGRNIAIVQDSSDATVTSAILTAGGAAAAANAGTGDFTNRGQLQLTSNSNITLGGSAVAARTGFAVTSIALDTTTVGSTSVTTVANSNTAINRLDATLASVSALRAQFGAIQNRMQSTIANLQAVVQNVDAARSRIVDADFAAETANLTKGQILRI
jgi:flagellin